MAIHKDFADWYRVASVTPAAELLEARWKGVEASAAALDGPKLIALLKLHMVRPPVGYKVPDFLDSAFRASDTTFPSRDNTEELRVLSGAILRQAIETDGPFAINAALGLISSSFGSRQETVTTPDHLRAANEYLALKGNSIRDTGAAPNLKIAPMQKERFDELMPVAIFAANQANTLRDPIINTINDQNNRLSEDLKRFGAALWHVVQVQREELNMLWWLQTRVSRDLRIPFSELGEQQAAVVLPSELADLTVFLPGPAAILGMILASMEVAHGNGNQMTVVSAVNSTSRIWRERLVAETVMGVDDLCPVSLAIARSLDTDGETDWLPVYRKQCDVKIEQGVASTVLASQIYTERLFSKSLSGIMK